MVFIGGPRQVGKTTLAMTIARDVYPKNTMYLNWDYSEHQSAIIKMQFDAGARLLIFDELHKYRKWKNYLKGLYDVHHKQYDMLVTGSARLVFSANSQHYSSNKSWASVFAQCVARRSCSYAQVTFIVG